MRGQRKRRGDIDFAGGPLPSPVDVANPCRGHREIYQDRIACTVNVSAQALDALRRQRSVPAAERFTAGDTFHDTGHVFQEPLGRPIAPDDRCAWLKRPHMLPKPELGNGYCSNFDAVSPCWVGRRRRDIGRHDSSPSPTLDTGSRPSMLTNVVNRISSTSWHERH